MNTTRTQAFRNVQNYAESLAGMRTHMSKRQAVNYRVCMSPSLSCKANKLACWIAMQSGYENDRQTSQAIILLTNTDCEIVKITPPAKSNCK